MALCSPERNGSKAALGGEASYTQSTGPMRLGEGPGSILCGDDVILALDEMSPSSLVV